MKIIKNIFLLGFLLLLFSGVGSTNVEAASSSFYTGMKCYYKHDNGKQAIIERKYTGDGIVNSVTRYKKDGNLDDTKDRTIAATGFYAIYNFTTECPKGVDIKGGDWFTADQIYPFDSLQYYKLTKEEITGEDIYNKLPKCEYKTNVSELKGDEYMLTHTPVFADVKTHLNSVDVKTLKFAVEIQKTVLKDGAFVWEKQSATPYLRDGNKYTTSCPQVAHYNPPGNIHEYVLTDSFDKPSGWSDDYAMERYVDFSSQEAEIDKIFNDYKAENDEVVGGVTKCFDLIPIDYSKCSLISMEADCLTLDELKGYSDKLVKAYDDAMAALRAVKLDGSNTGSDLESGKLTSSLYSEISDKYGSVITSIENQFTKSSDMISCAYEKFENQEGLTPQEQEEIAVAREASDIQRAVVINELARLSANFDNDLSDLDCSVILDDEIIEWMSTAFLFVQIGGAVAAVVLGMLDFSKAAASSEADAMKKAGQKFFKRILAVMLLLLLPAIIEFLLGLIDIPGLTNANPLCK